MINYEERLRERIRNLTKEDALQFLENMEWNVEMKDVWDREDYEYIDIIRKLIKEIGGEGE